MHLSYGDQKTSLKRSQFLTYALQFFYSSYTIPSTHIILAYFRISYLVCIKFDLFLACSSHALLISSLFSPRTSNSVASGATSPGAAIATASGAAATGGSSEAWRRTESKPSWSARRALSLWCFRRFWHFLAAKFKMTVSRHVVTDCNLRKCSWIFWNASGFVLRHSIQISGQLHRKITIASDKATSASRQHCSLRSFNDKAAGPDQVTSAINWKKFEKVCCYTQKYSKILKTGIAT